MPRVELLYFEGCPTYQSALGQLRVALCAEGLPPEVELVRVESDDEARRRGFVGSPTIRIGGEDVVPVPAGARPALACRVYHAADGRLVSSPPVEASLPRCVAQAARRDHQHGELDGQAEARPSGRRACGTMAGQRTGGRR